VSQNFSLLWVSKTAGQYLIKHFIHIIVMLVIIHNDDDDDDDDDDE